MSSNEEKAGGGLKEAAKKVPIIDVAHALEAVGTGFRLVGNGNTFSARCLANGKADTKPSLRLRRAKNSWKCFSCGAHGDGIELVKRVLDLGFPEALGWMRDEFGLDGALYDSTDPLAQWARLRGVAVASVRALGAQDAGGGRICFPMRLGVGLEPVGWKVRRADNEPVLEKTRSICEKGSRLGLFMPESRPEPSGKSTLVVCEGEADAVAAHSAGLAHMVGTPDKNWMGYKECREALEALCRRFPGQRVLVAHGDVGDGELLEQMCLLGAGGVRVPLYVSPEPTKRDLNEWLVQEGESSVREGILNTHAFTVIYKDAEDQVLEAVRRTGGLQARHVAPLRAVISYILQRVLPFARKYKGVPVGRGQWAFTRKALAGYTGVSEQTVRTLSAKLTAAGFWSLQLLGGKRGQLATVHHLSAYVKVTSRPKASDALETRACGDAPEESNRQEIQSNRQPPAQTAREGAYSEALAGVT